ncbi:MAG: AAA domain-containing protein [bacterium]
MIHDIIAAVELERRRIEEPRNRSRYFIFGKTGEQETDELMGFRFQSAPDRVLRDAYYKGMRREECLFRVGGVFVPGFMALEAGGVTVAFSFEELEGRGIDPDWVRDRSGQGVEYVMDSRELVRYLHEFLVDTSDVENPFFDDIFERRAPAPIRPVVRPAEYPDLNPSQHRAIEKCLSQRVTFVWGPPGTGKTKTLAALAANLIAADKRVLLSTLSNMALDQLLHATVTRLGPSARGTTIARMGSQMDEGMRRFGRRAFPERRFGAKRADYTWGGHVQESNLVAANFTMLTYPGGAYPGEFDYVIADEVSMANIPNLIAATCYAQTGVVLGGDPFQLPPIYPDDADVPNEWFRASVFEKAGVDELHDPRVAFLDTQYRMQRDIGDLVSDLFYGNELHTGTAPVPALPVFGSRVVFIHSAGQVRYTSAGTPGVDENRRFNEAHADTIVDTVLSFLDAGVRAAEIGVITPYNAQVVMVARMLQSALAGREQLLKDIKVSTVHSFQGQERRAIVVDFTDDNVPPTRLTAKWNLINVALSRAKEQLVIVGNKDYLLDEDFFTAAEVDIFEKMMGRARLIA